MAKRYPGLYLYFDWLKGLSKLPPEIAMKIIVNLYHYAEDGTEPEPLEDLHYSILQDMYFDQLKRSKAQEERARLGGYAKAAAARASAASDVGASYQAPKSVKLPEFRSYLDYE